jgi:hypothetical protein
VVDMGDDGKVADIGSVVWLHGKNSTTK